MDTRIGWLLDVTVEQNCVIFPLWIKLVKGKILKLIDTYQPNFYILPRNESTSIELFHVLSLQPRTSVESRVEE
jgi:hypothetical protein